jgi:hypothetical protein
VVSVPFGKLDTVTRVDTGAMQWVSVRTKYWLVALMRPVSAGVGGTFHGLVMRGDTAVAKIKRTASATTSVPLTNGEFAFDLYVGPQSWQELHALGNELENVNPYAGFMHGVVQPFATIVMRTLLWMKATFRVNYGWVLVLFGVVIRLLLWPLNQKAMRTSMQMQRLQPELQEIQKKYKTDPDKQRDALVKLVLCAWYESAQPDVRLFADAAPHAGAVRALFRVSEHDRVSRRAVSLAPRHLAPRPVLHHSGSHGRVDVLAVVDRHASDATEPADEDDELHDAGDVHGHVSQFCVGLESLLRRAEHRRAPQQWILTRERAKAGVVASTAPAVAKAGGGRKT